MLYTHTHIHSKSHFVDYVEFNFAGRGRGERVVIDPKLSNEENRLMSQRLR